MPFLDLKAQFADIREETMAAVRRVLESQHFILGAEVERFETAIARFVGCEFAIGCGSGSDALLLALMALEIGEGDEVITSPFTFVATAGSICRLRAKPVFVDIDPLTYNLDSQLVVDALTSRTRAIMPVHLFGQSADLAPIAEVAKARQVAIIEDAAQALGASYRGKQVGNIGDVGCFSFFPSKNLGGAGDGGMATTNDPELAAKLSVLRVHGSRKKYYYEVLGINSRLDALQAALLNVKLSHLAHWSATRRQNAQKYRELFAERALEGFVVAPFEQSDSLHVYNQFVIRVQKRDELQKHLLRSGIPAEVYYPLPLHLQKAFAYLGHQPGDFPEAERAAAEVLALPIYPELQSEQQRAVVNAISDFYLS